VHRHAHHVFGQADFGRIGVAVDDLAQDRQVERHLVACGQHRQGQVAALPGDDGELAARRFTHRKRREQPVRRDGCGELLDAVGGTGLADVGLGGDELVQWNGRHGNLLFEMTAGRTLRHR